MSEPPKPPADVGAAAQPPSTPAIPPPPAGTIASPTSASALPTSTSTPAPALKATAAAAAKPPPNPVLAALGLPNIRPRLPSRNWLIFLSVTSSITGLILYDKRETARAQARWVSLVAPLAEEALAPNQLPRRIRVYVQAPPGDSLGPAREHFYSYVKPVLAAGGVEWEVVEGRREGDVRFAVAEEARRRRRKDGEGSEVQEAGAVEMARERAGVREWEGLGGELVLGRHAWKEVVRGLHEGWLGPVDKPAEEGEVESVVAKAVEKVKEEVKIGVETLQDVVGGAGGGEASSPAAEAPETPAVVEEDAKAKEAREEEEKRRKLYKPAPYNSPADYASMQALPRSMPEQLGPSAVIPFPHLIGFLGTPRRVYRFFTRRWLADEIGRQTAALVLGTTHRPFRPGEQAELLAGEEEGWHKSVRRRERVEGKEDVWKDEMVLDERVAGRMGVFELSAADEERARELAVRPVEK